jgi:hypothetical protein
MNKPRTSLSLLDLHLLVSRSPNVAMLLGIMALSIVGLMAVTNRGPEVNSSPIAVSDSTAVAQRNFRAILIERSALDAAQQRIFEAATSHHLSVGRVDYAQETDQSGRFTVASMRFPVIGRYHDIRAFIESALAVQPALSLRHLLIERESSPVANEMNALLSATLTMQLLLGERERQ